jgi:hypothetical protein
MDLRRVSMSIAYAEDEQNIRYFLENAKLLEKLHLSFAHRSIVGLRDIPSTLKVLDLTVLRLCRALRGSGGGT